MKMLKNMGTGMAAIVLGLAGTSYAADAAPARNAGGRAAGQGPIAQLLRGRMEKLKELKGELNLTADQKEKIKQIVKTHKDEIAEAVKTVMEKRKALHEAVTASAPEESAIRTAASNVGKAIADAAVLRSKIHSEIAKVLTAEQLEKIKQFRAEHEKAVEGAVGGGLEELGKDL